MSIDIINVALCHGVQAHPLQIGFDITNCNLDTIAAYLVSPSSYIATSWGLPSYFGPIQSVSA